MHRRNFIRALAGLACAGIGGPALATSPSRRHDRDHPQDIWLEPAQRETVRALLARLQLIRQEVGYGRFKLIGLKEAKLLARHRPEIGPFSEPELALCQRIFRRDAAEYGFHGQRVIDDVNYAVGGDQAVKIAGSGNYLFRGAPQQLFERIQADIGDGIILTSGIRGVVMQTLLFLSKAERLGGNLSRASRSVAPPAYSWHARGDFDIGVRGLGNANFTLRLTRTAEYRQMMELGYVEVRYPRENELGVRYEPWHIKAV